jgi:tripartite-type tricarboxylate transporter receptor subunit TctC
MRAGRFFALGCVVAALLSSPHGQVSAQTWPTRPIDLVHGFAAGGNADTVARLIAAPLESALGKPVQVVARTGAGGNIATEFVARAQPDGHTLLLAVGGHAVSAALYKQLPFDPLKDFAFISNVSVNPFIIAVRKDSEIASLADLIARAKARPG